jgi:hypothetical protein
MAARYSSARSAIPTVSRRCRERCPLLPPVQQGPMGTALRGAGRVRTPAFAGDGCCGTGTSCGPCRPATGRTARATSDPTRRARCW